MMDNRWREDRGLRIEPEDRETHWWRSSVLPWLLGLVFLLSGCGLARTDMTALRDPAAPTRVYQKLLVWVPLTDLAWRTQAEQTFAEALTVRGVQGVPAYTVLLPTRTYTGEEAAAAVRAAEVDGVLVVSLRDAYSSQAYIPGSSTTTGSVSVFGNTAYYSGQTQQYGGYYLSLPRAHVDLKLLDVEADRVVWVASSLTRGNAYARFDTMLNSLVRETMDKLAEAQLIP